MTNIEPQFGAHLRRVAEGIVDKSTAYPKARDGAVRTLCILPPMLVVTLRDKGTRVSINGPKLTGVTAVSEDAAKFVPNERGGCVLIGHKASERTVLSAVGSAISSFIGRDNVRTIIQQRVNQIEKAAAPAITTQTKEAPKQRGVGQTL